MPLCRNEIDREARRVLRLMEVARLERRGAGFAVTQRAGGKARISVSAEIATAFENEGWIARDGDGRLGLTDQGRAHVARSRARAEPFRAQHGDVIDLGAGLKVERAGTALDALGRLKDEAGLPYLSSVQREAAARLERDFERAHLRPRVTLNIEAPAHRAATDGEAVERLSNTALDARRRVMDALAVAGPGLSDMLFEIVCLSRGLNEAERALGWPQRAGKALVRLGLERLAAHYGLMSGTRRPGRIEAWMESVAGEG
jgi:hypothetical protein